MLEAPALDIELADGQARIKGTDKAIDIARVARAAYQQSHLIDGAPGLREEHLPVFDVAVGERAISHMGHLKMMGAVQPFISGAISKTVNVPEDMPFEAFQDVYWDAYRSGCKGCTTYRPNPVTGAVLSALAPRTPDATGEASLRRELEANWVEATAAPPTTIQSPVGLLVRSEKLTGATYKLRWPDSEHAFYVTINDVETDGILRPFEIFINSKNLDHYQWIVALTRIISAVFRKGGDVTFLVDELKAVFDPRGGYWQPGGKFMPSIIAELGHVIEKHLQAIGLMRKSELDVHQRKLVDEKRAEYEARAKQADAFAKPHFPEGAQLCGRCSTAAVVMMDGCMTCLNCGDSKCG